MSHFVALLASFALLSATPVMAGELFERFIKLHPDGDTNIDERGVSPGSRPFSLKLGPTGVTEVALERGGCFGTCPQYTVKITSDGRVRYFGERFVSRLGAHTGHILPYRFRQLAEFIHDSGVAGFHDDYKDISVTDMETTYTLFVIDGTEKLISNYANSGPATLWAIEQLIDKLVSETKWDPPKKEKRRK
jgi:Domain of unknown function (DUF6438)